MYSIIYCTYCVSPSSFPPKKQNRDCVRKTYARYGVERFYRGALINIVRMAPNTAIQFGSYELLKQCTAGYF
jgi:hypothetical protein